MAFKIQVLQFPDAGKLTGSQIEVACDCWFSCSGKTIPRLIKFKDDEGVIQTLKNIYVISSEDKAFCGIKTKVYNCSTEFEGQQTFFKLIFNKEDCVWYISNN